jgi:acetyl esterase/lipase
MVQRLTSSNLQLPKVQVFIYPWLQMADISLPSCIHYRPTGITGGLQMLTDKFTPWYFGMTSGIETVQEIFARNEHFGLIGEDSAEFKRVVGCLDVRKIPGKYKASFGYYENLKERVQYPQKLAETSVLRCNTQLAEMFRKVFQPDVSPLFAHTKDLVGQPKAYFLIVEWDYFKDEGLLYAERLREAGVDVHVGFYENAYHGIASSGFIRKFRVARQMQTDLIQYLESNL